jgi:hypothetical protein
LYVFRPERGVGPADADWILSAGVILAVASVAAQTTAQLVDFGLFDSRITAIDSNRHASVFGALSLLAHGAAAMAVARTAAVSKHRRAWVIAAVLIAVLFALRLSGVGTGGVGRFLLLLPPAAALLVLLWYLSSEEPARARAVVRAGLCLLVLSYVVHGFGAKLVTELGYGGDSWLYEVKGVLKHGGELGGWILVAAGVAAFAHTVTARRGQLTLAAPTHGMSP